MASSRTVLYFTFRMWTAKSKKFAWDDPVQISIFDTLEGQNVNQREKTCSKEMEN